MPKVSARSRSDSSSETHGTRLLDRSSRANLATKPSIEAAIIDDMNEHIPGKGLTDALGPDAQSLSPNLQEHNLTYVATATRNSETLPLARGTAGKFMGMKVLTSAPTPDAIPRKIKRPKMFYDHVYEKHNVRLTPEEVEACNPYIRNGIYPRSKRSRSGRKSARTLVLASTSPSTALEPTYLYADEIESSPILQLPVPLAVPVIPESYPNQSTRNMFYTYDMGSPFVESSEGYSSASPSPSSIYGCDDSQSQQGYNSPHASGTPMGMHDQVFNLNYLTIPHSYAVSSSSHSYSTIGSPALTCRSSVASPSLSPSPAPETTRLYSTVHHATPEPELLMGFSLDMGQVALGDPLGTLNLKDIERDVQMETFLASLNEGVDDHGMGPENSASSPWGIEQGYGINGMSVVG
ncbi:hypothetical protein EV368DRAFT_81885 [Lentinula lateritia]|uniref:Uncharacterized protein n=1 Tax=Lentinula aff. lateritia TaxID=2804960 RepID=A0ACC1U354_9AGAR|nr:hypothetical protein F5876DRAFT_75808 [Lentinula aff. lateritia]KAJ3853106.1 hypothetical protein EV368DRAFT_81885 [Lentinula lateritia]